MISNREVALLNGGESLEDQQDPLEVAKRRLMIENRRLRNKLDFLNQEINRSKTLQIREFDDQSSMSSSVTIPEHQKFNHTKCFIATEQLVDVKVHQYQCEPVMSGRRSESGNLKCVKMDMTIGKIVKTSISFVDDSSVSNNSISALSCSVGKSVLSELEEFIDLCSDKNDLSGLISGLREYATLARERKEITTDVCSRNGEYLKSFAVEKGIVLKWTGGMFTMDWHIGWSENLGKMANHIEFFLKPENEEFNRACQAAFMMMTSSTSNSIERLEALRVIISKAILFH